MTALLFDLDGVLYQGDKTINGAREAVAWVQQQGIPYLFLTNTTSRPRSALVNKLAAMGIASHADQLMTPPVAACHWIKNNVPIDGDIALFIPQQTHSEFRELSLAQAGQTTNISAVVIGDFGERWDFHTLNWAFRLLMNEPPPALIALGMTRYWLAEDGLRLDTGPYVSALQYASGRTPVVLGKPAVPFFQAALQILGVPANQVYMIGDDIRGDIDGAQKAGIRALLVKTGKFQNRDLQLGILPNGCLNSVADLPRWWQENIDNPSPPS
jgi:phospholysine phosphohistidine inorganic pyrophosphate phosphatase